VTARRSVLSGFLSAAAMVPSLFWLAPAWMGRQALSFRDQGDFFFPLKLYTIDRLRRGEIPLWNPLSGNGEPWLANLQSGVFYPPSFLFLLPGVALAAALYLLLHFGIGAWGMWRFLREEAVSEAGSLFGAAVFCAGGYAASLSAYWNHFGSAAYLPGILALSREGLRTRGRRAALALLIGLQAMAGSPEISAATVVSAAFFSLLPRKSSEDQWARPSRKRTAARAVLAILLGLALASWALVPMTELLLHSERQAPLSAADREVGTAGTPALASALGISTGGHAATGYLASLYIGPLALFAAAAAYSERQRRTLVWMLTLMGLAGVLIAAAGPPGAWIRALPPFDRIRYPSKALVLPSFAISVLAGLGADSLRFLRGGTQRRWAWAAGGVAAFTLFVFSPLPPAVRWVGATGLAMLILLGLTRARSPAAGAGLQLAAALALVISMALAGHALYFFVPEAEIRRAPEGLAPLSRLAGRVLTPPMLELARWAVAPGDFGTETLRRQRQALLGYTNLLQGIPTVRTAAALPTRGARALTDAIDASGDPVRAAGPASARVLWTPFRPSRLPSQKIGDFFRAPIAPYRPRLSFVRAYRVEPDRERAWRRVSAGEIDLTREVFLDREPVTRIASDAGKPLLIARLAEDQPEKVVADITSNGPGLLVLTDLAFPGWTAQADGRPAELRVADGFFRAVPLTAGSHRVTFRYRPLSVLIGAAISVLSALALAAVLLLARPANARSLL
jgi:Bacterial membrane protein YfhO